LQGEETTRRGGVAFDVGAASRFTSAWRVNCKTSCLSHDNFIHFHSDATYMNRIGMYYNRVRLAPKWQREHPTLLHDRKSECLLRLL
jgi:hypothetical protein